MSESIAINMQKISKTYISGDIKVRALNNMSFKIESSERICVLGPSGSGKTTLLNLLGGITAPDGDGGELIIFGDNIQDYKEKEFTNYRRDRIGFIFQFFNLFPALNAIDNIVMGIDLLKKQLKKDGEDPMDEIDIYKIAKEYLEKVGLGERLYHYPSQLSGGEQQRVAIARALAKIPFIGKKFLLLCDEPTGNLDTETGHKIIELIKKLNEEIGFTVIFVTHNVAIPKIFATKIIHIKDGKIDKIETL
ncbi:MAG: ABC transporter ATP-binding protein [Promethearchaeota archaeon]